MDILQVIADELQIKKGQVEKSVELIDEGATIPFIARYRKEVTGSLMMSSYVRCLSVLCICGT